MIVQDTAALGAIDCGDQAAAQAVNLPRQGSGEFPVWRPSQPGQVSPCWFPRDTLDLNE